MNNRAINSNLKLLRSLASNFADSLIFLERQTIIHPCVSNDTKIFRKGRIISLQECLDIIEEYIYDLEQTREINDGSFQIPF